MAYILNIETTTTVCSVALAKDAQLLFLQELNEGYSHSENITIFIEEVIRSSGASIHDLEAIAVSSGPGSYTGLRIGVSTAKGMCFALDKPLIAVSTLKSMASEFLKSLHAGLANKPASPAGRNLVSPPGIQRWVIPMLDARRMEVYCAVYDDKLNEVEPVAAKIIDENSFSDFLKHGTVIFFGDGADKCKKVLSNNPNAVFVDDFFPSAAAMIELSEEKFNKGEFEDLSLFEPLYLKEFVAGIKGQNTSKP